MATDARRFVKAGFVLDQVARTEELGIEQEELNAYIVEQAYRLGVPPDRLAKEVVDRGQLGVAVTEVLRSKALDLLAERAAVTDQAGNAVDVKAIVQEAGGGGESGEAETAGEAEPGSETETVAEASGEAEADSAAGDEAEAAAGGAEAADAGAGVAQAGAAQPAAGEAAAE
jgi:trigger factor